MTKNADDLKKEDVSNLEKMLQNKTLCKEDKELLLHKIEVLNGRLDFHEDKE